MSNNSTSDSAYPKPLEARVSRIFTPFQEFIHDQTSGSLLLIVCTIIALLVANSPLAEDYQRLLDTPVGFLVGENYLQMSLHHWINDGLMSLFFFVLGLEIKREILVGELKDPKRSLPVIAAAFGGMLMPAAIFFLLNAGTATVHGWGIPMATDTAFAVGILALLGRHIPTALFTILTALAIIDDLGAILVIAVFYTNMIDWIYLGLACFILLIMVGCNLFGCRRPLVYVVGGGFVWLAMLGSGVHATVAGILMALTVPARPRHGPNWFIQRTRNLLEKFENIQQKTDRPILAEEDQHAVVERVQDTAKMATTPLRRWENALEHPISLFVMPVFALANAGIPLHFKSLLSMWTETLSLGIVAGLIIGKSIGITVLAWLAVKLNLGRLSPEVTLRHIIGIGLLGGMGFTMSIFIAGLGFQGNADALLASKTAVLLASLIAGVSGYLWLRYSKQSAPASSNNT